MYTTDSTFRNETDLCGAVNIVVALRAMILVTLQYSVQPVPIVAGKLFTNLLQQCTHFERIWLDVSFK